MKYHYYTALRWVVQGLLAKTLYGTSEIKIINEIKNDPEISRKESRKNLYLLGNTVRGQVEVYRIL